MSRIEAEALLEDDGEFLIRLVCICMHHQSINMFVICRESKGKYVLTAKGDGRCHHLLLIDDRGKVIVYICSTYHCSNNMQVKARDKEFKSVPDLVHHFTSSKLPLVMAGTDVFLNQPVLTAFP